MSRLIFLNANLLDGDKPARKANVVVAGERIEAVTEAPVEAAPGDRLVDLTGRTLMPGKDGVAIKDELARLLS